MGKLAFRPLTADVYDRTKADWTAQIEGMTGQAPVSPASYQSWFLLWEQWLKAPDMKKPFYAAVDEDAGIAKAIVSISYVPLGERWIKVLDAKVEPCLEIAQEEASAHPVSSAAELARLAAFLVVQCLSLTYNDLPAKTMKMCCQSPLDAQYLEGLITSYAALNDAFAELGIEIKTYRNWIELTKTA